MPYDEQSFLNGLTAGLTATAAYPKCDICTNNHIVNVEHGIFAFGSPIFDNSVKHYFGSGNPLDCLWNREYDENNPLVERKNIAEAGFCNYITAEEGTNIEKCAFFLGRYKSGRSILIPAVKKSGGNCYLTCSEICPCGKVIDTPKVRFATDVHPSNYQYNSKHYWYLYPLFARNNDFFSISSAGIDFFRYLDYNWGNIFSVKAVGGELFWAREGSTPGDFIRYVGSGVFPNGYSTSSSDWS